MSAPRWETLYSQLALNIKPSAIRALSKYFQKPGVISFANGNPDPVVFPVAEFAQVAEILTTDAAVVLQYGGTEGYLPLKERTAEWMSDLMGRVTKPQEMLITTGSQQGLDLFASVMTDPGDAVLVEETSYPGALHILRNHAVSFVPLPCDTSGIRVDEVPAIIEKARKEGKKVKFLYTIVNFQNPSGATLPLERRKALLEVAQKYDIVLFEDDPYGRIRFEGADVPSIFSLDTSGRVVYAGSYSKVLVPGCRVGWLVGAPGVIEKMMLVKQGTDLCTSTVTQAMVAEYCKRGHMQAHLPKIVRLYREKRDAMGAALQKYLPADAEYATPAGGFFYWVRVPGIDTSALLPKAVEQDVVFVTGESFSPDGTSGRDRMRLSFSFPKIDQIEEGAKRLAKAIATLK